MPVVRQRLFEGIVGEPDLGFEVVNDPGAEVVDDPVESVRRTPEDLAGGQAGTSVGQMRLRSVRGAGQRLAVVNVGLPSGPSGS